MTSLRNESEEEMRREVQRLNEPWEVSTQRGWGKEEELDKATEKDCGL